MRDQWRQLAPIPLRLVLGFGFMYHGFPKLFTAAGHESFVGMLQGIGVPAPGIMAWGVGAFEFFGGLALIVGALTALVSFLGIAEMVFAMITVHLPYGFNAINITGQTETGAPVFGMPGYELNLLYIAGFLALLIGGAGALSIDALRRGTREDREIGRLPVEPAATAIPDRAWTGEGEELSEPAGSGSAR